MNKYAAVLSLKGGPGTIKAYGSTPDEARSNAMRNYKGAARNMYARYLTIVKVR